MGISIARAKHGTDERNLKGRHDDFQQLVRGYPSPSPTSVDTAEQTYRKNTRAASSTFTLDFLRAPVPR